LVLRRSMLKAAPKGNGETFLNPVVSGGTLVSGIVSGFGIGITASSLLQANNTELKRSKIQKKLIL